MLGVNLISLQAVGVQSTDIYIAAQEVKGFKKGSAGVITLHVQISSSILLIAGDDKSNFILPVGMDAEGGHGLQGEVDVTAALHRRDDGNHAVPLHHGQRQA